MSTQPPGDTPPPPAGGGSPLPPRDPDTGAPQWSPPGGQTGGQTGGQYGGPRTGEPLPHGPLAPPPPPPGAAPPPPGGGYGWQGQPRTPFDPVAALALVFAFIIGPVGLVLSIVSLVRTRRGARRGRGLAIGGFVVSLLWIAGVTAIVVAVMSSFADRDDNGVIVSSGNLSVDDVRAGDCLEDFDEGDTLTVRGVPCAEPHQVQVYALFDLADGDFPGLSVVTQQAEEGCSERLPTSAAGGVEDGRLSVAYFHPQESTWSRGDREVACLVVSEWGDLTEQIPSS